MGTLVQHVQFSIHSRGWFLLKQTQKMTVLTAVEESETGMSSD